MNADEDDTGCLACCLKKDEVPKDEVAQKTMNVTDSPPEADNTGAAVAAGAAAGAGTAAVVATANDDDDEEKDLEKGEDDDVDPEAAPPPPADEIGDEETGDAGSTGDEAASEVQSEVQSEVPSVTPSEPSQVGEEITLEQLSQSMAPPPAS